MKEMYRLILESKGYVYDEIQNVYVKNKHIYIPESVEKIHYLKDIKSGVREEVYKNQNLEEYKRALACIRIFCIVQYNNAPQIRRLTQIPLAYTEDEDGRSIEVYLNLIGYMISFYYDKVLVERRVYNSIAEQVCNELMFLDFGLLVSVEDDWEENRKRSLEYLKPHSEPLSYPEACQFLEALVKTGLLQRDYREGCEGNIMVCRGGESEGFYSEPLGKVAWELYQSPYLQKGLWEAVEGYPGFEPVFQRLEESYYDPLSAGSS